MFLVDSDSRMGWSGAGIDHQEGKVTTPPPQEAAQKRPAAAGWLVVDESASRVSQRQRSPQPLAPAAREIAGQSRFRGSRESVCGGCEGENQRIWTEEEEEEEKNRCQSTHLLELAVSLFRCVSVCRPVTGEQSSGRIDSSGHLQ